MQFSTFVSSVAAAGALMASEAAAAPQMAAGMSTVSMMATTPTMMMSGEKMTMTPTAMMGGDMKGSEMPKATGTMMKGKPMVHRVMVGDAQGSLKFTPDTVQASVGHMVEFMFHPSNHSVAQAAFDKPCMPMEMAMPGMMGFFSGFQPVTGSEVKKFTIMVNSTAPMWFYSSAADECQKGMVGVINPPAASSQQTLGTFMSGAMKASMNVSPSMIMGGCDRDMGMAHHSGMAKGTGKAGMSKGGDRPKGMAMSTGSAMMMSGMMMSATDMMSGAPTAAAAAPASTSSGVKAANAAGGNSDLRSAGSPLGLLGVLAAAFVAYA